MAVSRPRGEVSLKSSSAKAFTLAEVLITLGIIGVVASLTMPSLIANHQAKATATKLKKAYSVLSQAFAGAIDEYGSIKNWAEYGDGRAYRDKMMENLAHYLNISKKCTAAEASSGCLAFESGAIKTLSGELWNLGPQTIAQLNDGTVFLIYTDASGSGWVMVGTNGVKTKQLGVDAFLFRFNGDKLVPFGATAAGHHESFEETCKDKAAQSGFGCAAWVLYNENLDYLKCDDLSWDGKTRCD